MVGSADAFSPAVVWIVSPSLDTCFLLSVNAVLVPAVVATISRTSTGTAVVLAPSKKDAEALNFDALIARAVKLEHSFDGGRRQCDGGRVFCGDTKTGHDELLASWDFRKKAVAAQ